MLEQVEILKGPSSVLYGKGSPGGVVNAISKLAGPDKDSEAVFDVGTNDRLQFAADFNQQLADNLYFRLVGLYRDSGTQVDFVEDNAVILMPSLTYDNGQTRVSAMFEYSDRDGDTAHQFLPLTATACATGAVSVDPIFLRDNATGEEIDSSTYHGNPDFNRYDTSSSLISLLASHEVNEDLSIDGVFRHKDGEAVYRQAWIAFSSTDEPRIDAAGDGPQTYFNAERSSEQTAVDVRARYIFETGPLDHELFAGVGLQHVETTNDGLALPGDIFGFNISGVTLNAYNPIYSPVPDSALNRDNFFDFGAFEADDLGIYISDQISFGDFKFNVGVRFDDVETTNDTDTVKDEETSFSIGALYAFENGFSPYISYAESFEPLPGTVGPDTARRPADPQIGEQVEVGIKYQPAGTPTYITAAYFDLTESSRIERGFIDGQEGNVQTGEVSVTGFEVEAQTVIGDWSLEGNFSLIDTELENGDPFDSIPEQQGSTWVQYQPSEGVLANARLGFGIRYVGENESNGVLPESGPPVRVVTDGVTLGDLLIGYTIEDWDLSLNARNITDEEYYGTCLARGDCFPGERRTVVARVAKKF